MRIKELRSLLSERLSSLENPALEARILLSFFLSMSHSELIINDTREIPEDRERAILDAAALRLEGVPMAYITGKKEFYGYTFSVNSDVLIPQPDTEILVETALGALKGNEKVLDICTGSGAIGASIAFALRRPVALSDISEDALRIARENYRNITGSDADARCGNLLEPWQGSTFDIIATNPPYLTKSWYEETEKDVKAEPMGAFIGGGEDGLSLIRSIISSSPEFLSPNGVLAIECDYRQTRICGRLLENNGFTDIHIVKDLADKERVIYGRRLPE